MKLIKTCFRKIHLLKKVIDSHKFSYFHSLTFTHSLTHSLTISHTHSIFLLLIFLHQLPL